MEISGKICHLTLTANLPLVSSTLAATLPLSQQVFEKVQIGPNGILGGLGETDSRKKTWSQKSCDTFPLKVVVTRNKVGQDND
jgi:hypothetical protein